MDRGNCSPYSSGLAVMLMYPQMASGVVLKRFYGCLKPLPELVSQDPRGLILIGSKAINRLVERPDGSIVSGSQTALLLLEPGASLTIR